jgi:hypothetical protein
LAQSSSGELRGKRGEDLAEALAQLLRLADVHLGRREAQLPGALLDAEGIVAARRGPGDARRAQTVEGDVLALRVAREELRALHSGPFEVLAQQDRAILVIGHPENGRLASRSWWRRERTGRSAGSIGMRRVVPLLVDLTLWVARSTDLVMWMTWWRRQNLDIDLSTLYRWRREQPD